MHRYADEYSDHDNLSPLKRSASATPRLKNRQKKTVETEMNRDRNIAVKSRPIPHGRLFRVVAVLLVVGVGVMGLPGLPGREGFGGLRGWLRDRFAATPVDAAVTTKTLVPWNKDRYVFKDVPQAGTDPLENEFFLPEKRYVENTSWSSPKLGLYAGDYGHAALGCPASFNYQDPVPLNKKVLVLREVFVPAGTQSVQISFRVDKKAKVYWNGTQVGAQIDETTLLAPQPAPAVLPARTPGYSCPKQSSQTRSPSNFVAGTSNLLALAVEGNSSGGTVHNLFIDVQVTAQVDSSQVSAALKKSASAAEKAMKGRLSKYESREYGDPINMETGAYSDSVTDAALPGAGVTFSMDRSYSSDEYSVAKIGTLGRGWAQPYEASLDIVAGGEAYVFNAPGGAGIAFNAAMQPENPLVIAKLTASGPGYEVRSADQFLYQFNSQGQLVRWLSPDGVGLSFTSAGRLITGVTDAAGRTVTLQYNGTGQLTGVVLPDGRQVSYGYTGTLLTTVTDLRGGITRYAYDGSNRLMSVTDPNNNNPVRLTYGADGRVASQLDPLGNQSTFTFGPGVATMTDAAGNTWTARFTPEGFPLSETNPLGTTTQYAFNAVGDRVSQTDANGRVATFTYDAVGNVLTALMPDGTTTSYTYDSRNNLASMTDAKGRTSTFVVDSQNRPTQATDSLGRSTTFTYTAAGQVSTVTDPAGGVWQIGWDSSGNLTSARSPAGRTTSFTYDLSGRVRTATDAIGGVSSYTHDASDNLISVVDALSRTTQFQFDLAQNLTSVTDAAGGSTTFRRNAANEITSIDLAGGGTSQMVRDNRGLLTRQVLPSGATTTYGYDRAGRLTSTVSPRGNIAGANPALYTTSFEYSTLDEVVAVVAPDTGRTTYTYDVMGRVVTSTDPTGRTTRYGYDQNGNVTDVTDPSGAVTRAVYDGGDRVTQVVDPLGRTSTTQYDVRDRVIAEISPLGNKTTYTYDADSNLTKATEPRGNTPGTNALLYTSTAMYDQAGRITRVIDPLGAATTLEYDPVGNLTRRVDPNGNATSWRYDNLNRLTTVVDALGGTTTYAYDAAGNLTGRTDANNRTTSYGYDLDRQLTQITNPAGSVWRYGRNADGAIETATDAVGNVTRALFDQVGRTTGIDYTGATPDVGFAYDNAGRLTAASDTTGNSTGVSYDPVGRPSTYTRNKPSGADTISYGWDAASQLVRRDVTTGATPTPNKTSFSYDNDGRLASIAGAPNGAVPQPFVNYTYDPAGNTTSEAFTNGQTSRSTYDRAGRLTATLTGPAAQPNTVITGSVRSYDSAGNPTRIVTRQSVKPATGTAPLSGTTGAVANPQTNVITQSATATYSYDKKHQLTAVCLVDPCTGATNRLTYGYDKVGNRTLETRNGQSTFTAYDAADRATTIQTPGQPVRTQTYDANGSLLTNGVNQQVVTAPAGTGGTGTLNPTGGPVALRYDTAGRLIEARVRSKQSGRSVIETYGYDPFGNRITINTRFDDTRGDIDPAPGSTFLPGQSTPSTPQNRAAELLWDPLAATPTLLAERNSQGQLLRSYTTGPAGGTVAAATWLNSSAQLTATHFDPLGSLAAVTAMPGGAALNTTTYEPYGRTLTSSNLQAIAPNLPLGYGGGYQTPNSPLTQLGYRDLDPSTGQFTTTDPLSPYIDDPYITAYSYANNRPTALVDPWGLRAGLPKYSRPDNCLLCLKNVKNIANNPITKSIATAVIIGAACATGVGCVAVLAGAAIGAGVSTLTCPKGKSKADCAATGAFTGAASSFAGAGAGQLLGKAPIMIKAAQGAKVARYTAIAAGGAVEGAAQSAVTQVITTGKINPKQLAKDTATSAGLSVAGNTIGDAFKKSPCASFSPETPVVMADGRTRPIRDIRVGDLVLATNPVTGISFSRRVTATPSHVDNDLIDIVVRDTDNKQFVIETTDHHPIWDKSTNQWVYASNLIIGHQLQTSIGNTATVAELRPKPGERRMLDLTVDTDHTFNIQPTNKPILVHNVNECQLTLKYKEGWTPEQIAEANSKVASLNTAAENGQLVLSQSNRSGSAAAKYRAAGKTIPELADVDHTIDLQLGGLDDVSNMAPLNFSVNRSLGPQIACQLRNLPLGTKITSVSIC